MRHRVNSDQVGTGPRFPKSHGLTWQALSWAGSMDFFQTNICTGPHPVYPVLTPLGENTPPSGAYRGHRAARLGHHRYSCGQGHNFQSTAPSMVRTPGTNKKKDLEDKHP